MNRATTEGTGPGGGWTRREAVVGTLAAWGIARGVLRADGEASRRSGRPRVAAVVTEYRKMSHGQGIVDRFLEGYGWGGRHRRPEVDVVALYVDQRPEGDLSGERAARHSGLTIYPTIADALTRGGSELAVDGVLIIGEHGNYPRNAKGQTLYPRYEFFEQTVEVFRRSGRSVPVFNDKHLSWSWDHARKMVDTARAMGFPFLAGSSLPLTWRIPSVDLPWGAEVEEVVAVGYGGVDSYDFHGLETLQCIAERRRGGETGVRGFALLRGPAVWEELDSGGCDPELFEACLCRSFTLSSPRAGYGNALPERADLPRMVADPLLYRIEYADGLKGSLLMLNGLVSDFTVAARIRGESVPFSTQMYLPGIHPGGTLPNFFSALAYQIERMFVTGQAPYPVERTLLTTGFVAAAVDLLAAGQSRLETPHLREVAYQAPRESLFVRS
jgi:hypothetical protein